MANHHFVANALGAAYLAQALIFVVESSREDLVQFFADPDFALPPEHVEEYTDQFLQIASAMRDAAVATVEAQEISDAAERHGTLDA